MMKIIELDVGQAGRRYVEDVLDGQGGLAEKARTTLPILQGRVTALVPEGTTLERATEFRLGNIATAITDDPWVQLARHLIVCSHKHQISVLISQDLAAQSTDHYIRNQCTDIPKFFYQSTVYWFAKSGIFTIESIENIISYGRDYVPLMFYADCGINEERCFRSRSKIDESIDLA